MLPLKTRNCHGLCLISPFNRGNLYLSRGLCWRLPHAIFSRRTRSGRSLSLRGKVRGQRMTTDRSCSPLIRPVVSAVSFILCLPIFCVRVHSSRFEWQTFSRRVTLTDRVRQPGPVDHENSVSRDGAGHSSRRTDAWVHLSELAACLTRASLLL